MSFNEVLLIGHLGKEPLALKAKSQSGVSFSLATDEFLTQKNGEKKKITTWHNLVAWGYVAENIAKYCSKGSKVFVKGRLTYSTYEKNGVEIKSAEILVNQVLFLDNKEKISADSSFDKNSPTKHGQALAENETEEIDDEDLGEHLDTSS